MRIKITAKDLQAMRVLASEEFDNADRAAERMAALERQFSARPTVNVEARLVDDDERPPGF